MRRSVLLPLILASASCAPMVTNRNRHTRGHDEPPAQPTAVAPKATAKKAPAVVARTPDRTPVVAPAERPAPVLVRAPAPQPAAAPAAVEPERPAERTSYYAFSESEIRALAKRSKKFARVQKDHQRCTARTQQLITKREDLRQEIIVLQNLEYPTPSQVKRLRALRDDEWQMKNDHSSLAACQPLEEELASMLRERYGTTASLY